MTTCRKKKPCTKKKTLHSWNWIITNYSQILGVSTAQTYTFVERNKHYNEWNRFFYLLVASLLWCTIVMEHDQDMQRSTNRKIAWKHLQESSCQTTSKDGNPQPLQSLLIRAWHVRSNVQSICFYPCHHPPWMEYIIKPKLPNDFPITYAHVIQLLPSNNTILQTDSHYHQTSLYILYTSQAW